MDFAAARWKYKNDPEFYFVTNSFVRALKETWNPEELHQAVELAQRIVSDEKQLGVEIHLDDINKPKKDFTKRN